MKINNLKKLGTLITLTGDVDSGMIKSFDAAIEKIVNSDDKVKKATILLSTTGGNSVDGDAVAERIKFASSFVDLQIIAMTYVMSAGVRVFLSLPREKRFASTGAIIMIHPMGRGCDAVSKQSIAERKRRLTEEFLETEFAEKREVQWIRALAKAMGKSYSTTRAMWFKSHRFTAKEALKHNLIASIIR